MLNSTRSVSATNNEELCVADADILAHFDNLPMIFNYAFNRYNISCNDIHDWMKKYLYLDYCDLSDREKVSFKDKYENPLVGASKEFPAKLPKNLSAKIKAITQKVYTACGFSGVIRIDYIYSQNKLYLNEINSIPGSLAYYLFCDSLKEFKEMLTPLIEKAVENFNEKSVKTFSYSSGVLKVDGAKGGKRLTRNN